MGAKDTMKTFFASMNEQVAPTSGYGPRIISTPMGPFSWNDNLGVWVNTNNGMQLNNIAFQDMYAMMDYETMGGGIDYKETFLPLIIDRLGNITGLNVTGLTGWYSSLSGPTTPGNAGTLTIKYYGAPSITLTRTNTAGFNPKSLYYTTTGSNPQIWTSPTTITGSNNTVLRIGIATTNTVGQTGSGNIFIAINGVTAATIPYTFTTGSVG